jgi:lipopolysaccharide transport system ATP-binding protein
MKPIIRIEGIGKQYYIGGRSSPNHGTLKETLSEAFRSLFRSRDHNGDSSGGEWLWVLKDISFEVNPGEVVGIIGRNGAGKSTLLKILSRVSQPTCGKVELYGRMGCLLEVGTGFHPELSGRENIFLNGAVLGMSRREVQRKYDEIVDFAEIEKFLETAVKHYSSGMFMRLAFAIAVHLEPEILIVDEVLAVGDLAFQKKCMEKMAKVARTGRTVLFVSHSLSAVNQLCNRAILLDKGVILEQGDTAHVTDRYLQEISPATNDAFQAEIHDKDMFVAEAHTQDGKGQVKSCFTNDDDIVIAMSIRINRWVSNTTLGLIVRDHRNRRIFTANNPIWSKVRPGRNQVDVTATIPRHFLVPGQYFFTLAVTSPAGTTVDWVEDVLPIAIVDGGSEFAVYEGKDYGCVFDKCTWEIESELGHARI